MQNLVWGIYQDQEFRHCLYILCVSCKTRLDIPHQNFKASIELKREYPKGMFFVLDAEMTKDDKDFLKNFGISPEDKS